MHTPCIFIYMNKTEVLQSTPCASAALAHFGVKGTTWNNRTRKNVWIGTLRRQGYSVRSRASKLTAGATVGGSRSRIAQIAAAEPDIIAFIVRVERHILVLDRTGATIVDTDERLRDKRKVHGLVAVFAK